MPDKIIIPPQLRAMILEDLQSGHMGIDKMNSLARLTCWWPEIDADITRKVNSCDQCFHKIQSQPSKWTPWPVNFEPWQRIHADYCGPFLQKYYALVVVDAFSGWSEVFYTASPNADFTVKALRKLFSREGVALTLVTDNGAHFTAQSIETWLKGIGCRHVFTAPRHPRSNGLAERFVKTLKSAMKSLNVKTYEELERQTDNFLLQYRSAIHCGKRTSPAQLFRGRKLRSAFQAILSADVAFTRGNEYRPAKGIIIRHLGERMVEILDLADGTCHRRHFDQIAIRDETNSDSYEENAARECSEKEEETEGEEESEEEAEEERNGEEGRRENVPRRSERLAARRINEPYTPPCGAC